MKVMTLKIDNYINRTKIMALKQTDKREKTKNKKAEKSLCWSIILFLNKLKSFGTIIKRNQISAPNIEAIKIFDCLLRIKNILINNESSPFLITF